MGVNITVVEGANRQLVPAIRDAGLTVAATLPMADLPNLERAARPPDLLILDLRGEAGVPPVLGVLKRKFAQMAVLIVASQLDPAMMLEAMRAGVSDFVTEPLGPDQVKEAIERIIGSQAPAAPGKVLAFLGAKGGVGATTLAVNVAVAVAADRPNSVLMADLHAAVHGDVGILLGVEPRFSVIDALQNLNRLDGAYLRSLVLRAKSGVDALTSPETPALRPPDAQQIRTLIDRLAANYRYVVLDVPRSDFGVLDALEPTTAIMLVVNQELPTVRRAAQLGNLLRQRYGKDRVATVVSRYDPRADIGQEDIERVIGLPVWGVLPSDYRKVLLAANAGRPLVTDNHSRLAASVVQLARQLTGPGIREDGEGEDQEQRRLLLVMSTTTYSSAGDLPVSHYQEVKTRIHEQLLNRLNLERLSQVKRSEAEPELRTLINTLLEKESETTPLNLQERETLVADVFSELFGLGPLEAILADKDVSDILVNRHNQVYVEKFGLLEPLDVIFKDNRHLMRIIERIVSSVGRRIDESSPMVDARLQDGSRVNAIIPPLALDGPVLSIRRFRTDRLGAQDLVEKLALTEPMMTFLKAAVACRLNIMISGGTGAGKTTLLNVLSSFIGDTERVITIEDAAELMLRQKHVVRLETRPANIEGKGAIRQRQLVVNALRMRPDRIVLGEIRGEEAIDMLQAMNTGHDGSLTTIHANTPRDALYRLDTMVAMADLNIPDKAIRHQVASAIDLVVQVARLADGTRRVTQITELTGMEGEVITMQDLFMFERTGRSPQGKVLGRFRATGIRPKASEKIIASGMQLPTHLFEHSQVVE